VVVNALAAVAAVVFLRPEPGGRADPGAASGVETYRRLLDRAAVRALVAFRFAFSFGKTAVVLFLPIFARVEFGMNPLLIGGILAGGKLTKSVSQGYVGSLGDRVGHEEWFIVAGTLLYAGGTALIPFSSYAVGVVPGLTVGIPGPFQVGGVGTGLTLAPAFLVLFTSYALLGIADSLRLPTSMSLFVEEGEHYDAVSSSLSLRTLSWQVGAVVGPVAVGVVSDSLSYFAAFWLASATMLLAAVVFGVTYRSEPAPRGSAVGVEPGD
jgi:MFS family permease